VFIVAPSPAAPKSATLTVVFGNIGTTAEGDASLARTKKTIPSTLTTIAAVEQNQNLHGVEKKAQVVAGILSMKYLIQG
jgi:hypothetical protein